MAAVQAGAGVQADFPDGVAVVVGGSGGMGREICKLLAERGTDVALTYRNNAGAAEEARESVKAAGRRAFVASLDISRSEDVKAYFDELASNSPRVHTIIVATGADIRMQYIAEVPTEDFEQTMLRDCVGFFNVAKSALPHLRKGGGGSFVVTTSAALVRHSPKDILSTAPKAGIEALLRGIAREEARFGIRANSVALGVIDGGLMDRVWPQLSPEFGETMKRNIPLKRLGKPVDVAEAAVFLASSRASFITGQRLVLDGGYSV